MNRIIKTNGMNPFAIERSANCGGFLS